MIGIVLNYRLSYMQPHNDVELTILQASLDVMYDQNSISYKANIWQCISLPMYIDQSTLTSPVYILLWIGVTVIIIWADHGWAIYIVQ